MTEQLLTAREVADWFGVPVSWVRESTRSGAMPCVELGRYRRYECAEVERWMPARTSYPNAAELAEARLFGPSEMSAPAGKTSAS